MSPINFQRLGVALIIAALGGGWMGTVSVWALAVTGLTGLAILYVATEFLAMQGAYRKKGDV